MANDNGTDQLEDTLTDLEPNYESEAERNIGRLLDQYGIPFFYRQPTVICNDGRNEIHRPSFSLLSYGGTVIDYINGASEREILSRQELYRYNQIPAVVVGPRDLDRANWDKRLYERLQETNRGTIDPFQYGPDPSGS